MRKLGSYLIILIFLTAYGRCVADQFGMLHTSDISCCVTVCNTTCDADDHGPDTPDHHPEESETPDHQDEPSPCQLCFILNSDSMMLEHGIKIPSPSLLELPDIFSSFATLDDLFRGPLLSLSPDLTASDHPDPPAEQRSRLLRTVARMTPVRGPSIA